ncbi:hypothetical protein B9Z19DRAFT_993665 [Tuber borchii]|uniref:Uncharacterized protein n=1 Tax=Tuber borchii TaxID=42251 RepID=A0A2T6ZJH4_TUBBO|nr:hypothetical protein B9Z19DRAFT_993665 [Tuber borchii]
MGSLLTSRPDPSLFLDEPTSELDSQSPFLLDFQLSQAWQAIISTILQLSSMLIQQFDMTLARNPGGKTFYFGPIGKSGADVILYFLREGSLLSSWQERYGVRHPDSFEGYKEQWKTH